MRTCKFLCVRVCSALFGGWSGTFREIHGGTFREVHGGAPGAPGPRHVALGGAGLDVGLGAAAGEQAGGIHHQVPV